MNSISELLPYHFHFFTREFTPPPHDRAVKYVQSLEKEFGIFQYEQCSDQLYYEVYTTLAAAYPMSRVIMDVVSKLCMYCAVTKRYDNRALVEIVKAFGQKMENVDVDPSALTSNDIVAVCYTFFKCESMVVGLSGFIVPFIPMSVFRAISAFRNDPEVVSHIPRWRSMASNVYLESILGLLGQPISEQAILRYIETRPPELPKILPLLLLSLEHKIRFSEVNADFISTLFTVMRKADEI